MEYFGIGISLAVLTKDSERGESTSIENRMIFDWIGRGRGECCPYNDIIGQVVG